MNKRVQKKVASKYNFLKRADRQKRKRRGRRCIDYALIPMGKTDKSRFVEEGDAVEYPYATHWFIEIAPHDTYYYKHPYIIYVYPCTSKATSDTNHFLEIIYAGQLHDVMMAFKNTVEDMKKDRHVENFWDSDSPLF
ncbi:hypothetical protein [Oceanobacillus manasiensis]|uniref:hypothetical protein n=1 Tax=Oceanobacillus manasiensis TaxID=586413 RepID=UPI0005A70D6E|nr:hypothetical protein [Oceanobacillus manasiensis]